LPESLEHPHVLRPTTTGERAQNDREIRKLWGRVRAGDKNRKFDQCFSLPGRIYVSESGLWFPPNFGGRLVEVVASLRVVGSTDTVVAIKLNDVTIATGGTVTIPAGTRSVVSQSVDEFVTSSDFFSVACTTPGVGAKYLTVQLRLQMA
jgi:hypothetical protein